MGALFSTDNPIKDSDLATSEQHDMGLGALTLMLLIGIICKAWIVKVLPIPYTVLILICGLIMGTIRWALYNYYYDMKGDDDNEPNNLFWNSFDVWINISPNVILYAILPVLIFESAFASDLHIFMNQIVPILTMAMPVVVFLSVVTGLFICYFPAFGGSNAYILPRNGDYAPLAESLMLGSMLSATDPVAVVGILKELGVAENLSILIEGESLLNDGSAIVLFTIFSRVVFNYHDNLKSLNYTEVVEDSVYLIFIGPLIGLLCAMVASYLMGRILNDLTSEITLTIIVSYGSYLLAQFLGSSGVLAMATGGLWLSFYGLGRISASTTPHLKSFWEIAGYVSNTLIFFVSGLILADKAFRIDPSLCSAANGIDSANEINLPRDDNGKDYLFLNSGEPSSSDNTVCSWRIKVNEWLNVILLYLFINFSRFFVVFVCFPILKQGPYGINWKHAIVMAHGGLRGAVGLTLALAVQGKGQETIQNDDNTGQYEQALCSLILFYMAGCVLLTLLINGTTTSKILNILDLDKPSEFEWKQFVHVMKGIEEQLEELVEDLQLDPYLGDANWSLVWRYIPCSSAHIYWHRIGMGHVTLLKSEIDMIEYYIKEEERTIANKLYKEQFPSQNNDQYRHISTSSEHSTDNRYVQFSSPIANERGRNLNDNVDLDTLRNFITREKMKMPKIELDTLPFRLRKRWIKYIHKFNTYTNKDLEKALDIMRLRIFEVYANHLPLGHVDEEIATPEGIKDIIGIEDWKDKEANIQVGRNKHRKQIGLIRDTGFEPNMPPSLGFQLSSNLPVQNLHNTMSMSMSNTNLTLTGVRRRQSSYIWNSNTHNDIVDSAHHLNHEKMNNSGNLNPEQLTVNNNVHDSSIGLHLSYNNSNNNHYSSHNKSDYRHKSHLYNSSNIHQTHGFKSTYGSINSINASLGGKHSRTYSKAINVVKPEHLETISEVRQRLFVMLRHRYWAAFQSGLITASGLRLLEKNAYIASLKSDSPLDEWSTLESSIFLSKFVTEKIFPLMRSLWLNHLADSIHYSRIIFLFEIAVAFIKAHDEIDMRDLTFDKNIIHILQSESKAERQKAHGYLADPAFKNAFNSAKTEVAARYVLHAYRSLLDTNFEQGGIDSREYDWCIHDCDNSVRKLMDHPEFESNMPTLDALETCGFLHYVSSSLKKKLFVESKKICKRKFIDIGREFGPGLSHTKQSQIEGFNIEEGQRFFMLLRGVLITDNDTRKVVPVGSVIGMVDPLLGKPSKHIYTAKTTCHLLIFNFSTFLAEANLNRKLLKSIWWYIAFEYIRVNIDRPIQQDDIEFSFSSLSTGDISNLLNESVFIVCKEKLQDQLLSPSRPSQSYYRRTFFELEESDDVFLEGTQNLENSNILVTPDKMLIILHGQIMVENQIYKSPRILKGPLSSAVVYPETVFFLASVPSGILEITPLNGNSLEDHNPKVLETVYSQDAESINENDQLRPYESRTFIDTREDGDKYSINIGESFLEEDESTLSITPNPTNFNAIKTSRRLSNSGGSSLGIRSRKESSALLDSQDNAETPLISPFQKQVINEGNDSCEYDSSSREAISTMLRSFSVVNELNNANRNRGDGSNEDDDALGETEEFSSDIDESKSGG